jgi:hypothetical protein
VIYSEDSKLSHIGTFFDPPNNKHAIAFLTSEWPKIEGPIIEQSLAYASGLCTNSLNSIPTSWKDSQTSFF